MTDTIGLLRESIDRDLAEAYVLLHLSDGEGGEDKSARALSFFRDIGLVSDLLILCDAYQSLHYWVDLARLERSSRELEDLIDQQRIVGPSASLLFRIRTFMGVRPRDQTELARRAVDVAPDWVTSRAVLADAMADSGDFAGAAEQIGYARSNCISGATVAGLSPERLSFEACFTGRLSDPATLVDLHSRWSAAARRAARR